MRGLPRIEVRLTNKAGDGANSQLRFATFRRESGDKAKLSKVARGG